MENNIFELQYAIDTFYFLICGALVMWMAAGFAMLEAGLVRAKNTAEILTKNIALFAVSCTMYLVFGYAIMYGGGIFLSGIDGGETLVADALAASAENGFGGDSVYSSASDFFFQVVFVATAMSIVSGAVASTLRVDLDENDGECGSAVPVHIQRIRQRRAGWDRCSNREPVDRVCQIEASLGREVFLLDGCASEGAHVDRHALLERLVVRLAEFVEALRLLDRRAAERRREQSHASQHVAEHVGSTVHPIRPSYRGRS